MIGLLAAAAAERAASTRSSRPASALTAV